MVSLITVPSSTTTLTNASAWSDPLFQSLIVIAIIGVGLIVGGMVVAFLAGKVVSSIKIALGKHRRGGRRRR